MGHYESAQVCMNGHMTCSSLESFGESASDHCPECGAETIVSCQGCGSSIRGHYVEPGVLAETITPAYCHKCSKAYPWTIKAIDALRSIINEDDRTSDEQKRSALASIPDIIANTPGTQLALSRIKRFIGAARKETKESIIKSLADVACEAAKRGISPS